MARNEHAPNRPSTPDTRPGAHSSKNARQAGAPNPHQSKETLMVGTPDQPYQVTPTQVQARIAGESYRFLAVDENAALTVHMPGLAELVTEIITEHTMGLVAALNTLEGALADAAWDIRDLTDQAGGER